MTGIPAIVLAEKTDGQKLSFTSKSLPKPPSTENTVGTATEPEALTLNVQAEPVTNVHCKYAIYLLFCINIFL